MPLRRWSRRLRLGVASFLQAFLPDQRMFRVRARMYRWASLEIDPTARICGTARFVYSNVRVGKDTFVGPGVAVFSNVHAKVSIGDHVDIAPQVTIHVGTHRDDNPVRRAGSGHGEDIEIGDGSWLGVRAVILYGTRIGKRCIVTPGAVVRGVFPDDVLIGGVPAKILKELHR